MTFCSHCGQPRGALANRFAEAQSPAVVNASARQLAARLSQHFVQSPLERAIAIRARRRAGLIFFAACYFGGLAIVFSVIAYAVGSA